MSAGTTSTEPRSSLQQHRAISGEITMDSLTDDRMSLKHFITYAASEAADQGREFTARLLHLAASSLDEIFDAPERKLNGAHAKSRATRR